MADEQVDKVVEIVKRVGKLANLGPDDDIYDAGVSSITALPLLMDLEAEFGVSLGDDEFVSARTARALASALQKAKN